MLTDLEKAVAREFRLAKDNYDDNFREDDEKAYDYFNGDLPQLLDADIDEAFTEVVSSDVADSIEHTLADIMPAFASEAPVSFIPSSAADEKQTQIETQLVNDIFIQQSDGFIQLTTACKDALLQKIGVIEVETVEKVSVEYLTLHDIAIPVLMSLLLEEENNPQPDVRVEVVDWSGQSDSDTLDLTTLEGKITVTLRKTTKAKQLLIHSFAPDELLINSDHEELNLDTARFVCRQRVLTASELVELGYSKDTVDALPTYSTGDINLSPNKRGKTDLQLNEEASNKGLRNIRVAFAYYMIDLDNDGIAERYRIVMAGHLESSPKVLEKTPIDSQPYCIGVPFIRPHNTRGISLYEKIKQVQDVKTKLIRQLLTAGERAIRGRIGVVGTGANLDDLKETLFGGIVRLTNPNGVVPLPMDRYPPEVESVLGMMDKKRKESGGSAVDKANEEILVGGDTAHGLERIMSAMEQLNSLVAKTLAETLLRQVYVKIHANLRKHFNQPMEMKFEGKWVSATPSEWPERQKVAAALGLTMGDRLRLAGNYNTLLTEQMALQEKGSILVNEQSIYSLMIARANALMIPSAHSFYVDPSSPEGQQAAQQRSKQAEQQKQEDMQVKLMNLQLLPEVEKIRGQASIQVQTLRNQVEELKAQLAAISDTNEYDTRLKEIEVKLMELNAKYDHEPVPDSIQS